MLLLIEKEKRDVKYAEEPKKYTRAPIRKLSSFPKTLHNLISSCFSPTNARYKPMVGPDCKMEQSGIKPQKELLQFTNTQRTQAYMEEQTALRLNSAFNKAEKLQRIEKPIRVRILRFCHRCNTIYGRSRRCANCEHVLCGQCTHHPLGKRTERAHKPNHQKIPNFI